MPFFETVSDLCAGADVLRRRHYGVIEVVEGRLARIVLRPFAKYVSVFESLFFGGFYHRRVPGDRCRLFYNQPRGWPNYLALKYLISAQDTRLPSVFGALAVLDEIARIKRSDAILTDAANLRISERLLAREGWQRHTNSRYHRNYIKRFYGEYPTIRSIPLTTARQPLEAFAANHE